MKKINLHALAPIFGLIVFAGALWVLHHSLTKYNIHDIFRELSLIPAGSLALAFLLTAFSYLLMTGYDWLAFRYIAHPLPYRRIALAGFIGYSLSNNVGNVLITGGSIRYRIYSAWGLSALDIARIVLHCTVTFSLGILTLGGLYFVIKPMTLPPSLDFIPQWALHAFGAFCLAAVAAYLALALFRRRPFTLGGLSLFAPSSGIALSQVFFSSLDIAASAGVLYVLLPPIPDLSFIEFLGYYVLAFEAGFISQVPGGLGVFESIMLVTFSAYGVEPPVALGALLAYRGIFYIFPLIFGVALLLGQEISEQTHRLQPLAHSLGWSAHLIVPNLMALLVFIAGVVLLLSGSLPAEPERLAWLGDLFPLASIEISHLLAGLCGVSLLFFARGLQRRSKPAFYRTLLILAAGIVFLLFKGLDYKEALYLALVLMIVLPCRRHFYRRASFFSERFPLGWIAAIAIVLLSAAFLGLLSHRRIPYAENLWLSFSLDGDAARAFRSTLGVWFLSAAFVTARLFHRPPPEPRLPDAALLDRAESIVRRSPLASAWLALLGDKRLLFDDADASFVMYGVHGRSWIALGDPVGPEAQCSDLIWNFRDLAERHGGLSVFYQVSEPNLQVYLDLGLTPLKIGEEARVALADFDLAAAPHRPLREAHDALAPELSFEVLSPGSAAEIMPELRAISANWLATREVPEHEFAFGAFKEYYLRLFPIAVVRRAGEIVAFAAILPGVDRHEAAVDLARHAPDAPAGIVDYLFLEILLWARAEGFVFFNLGAAPLSALENRELAPVWDRIGPAIFHHGEHFSDFGSLHAFKEKFAPAWRPLYLASPASVGLAHILLDVAALIKIADTARIHRRILSRKSSPTPPTHRPPKRRRNRR